MDTGLKYRILTILLFGTLIIAVGLVSFGVKNVRAADSDRSAEYILNRVWASDTNTLRVS